MVQHPEIWKQNPQIRGFIPPRGIILLYDSSIYSLSIYLAVCLDFFCNNNDNANQCLTLIISFSPSNKTKRPFILYLAFHWAWNWKWIE